MNEYLFVGAIIRTKTESFVKKAEYTVIGAPKHISLTECVTDLVMAKRRDGRPGGRTDHLKEVP